MSWVRSRLFWKVTGLYSLLSGIALSGLLVMLTSQLSTHAATALQGRIQRVLDEIGRDLESGKTPDEVLLVHQSRLTESGIKLRIVDQNSASQTVHSSSPENDITIQSVVRAAIKNGQVTRRLRLMNSKEEQIVIGQLLPAAATPSEKTLVLLAIVDANASQRNVDPVHSAALRTALFSWIIGISCVGFVTAGIVGPLQSMSLNLNQTIDRVRREDMLLTISDRHDELGQVANSLHELEEERQDQISQLQQTERMARSSADLLTTVLDSMVEGVIAIDRESKIVFLNHGARRLLNLSPAIGIGHRLYEAIRVPAFLDAVAESIQSQEMQTLEYRASREQLDLVLVSIPILKGPHAGAVAVVRDISETRRLEAMRRDFVSGVSHELKTPLTVIQACTDTLLGGALSDPEAAERFLKQIDEQSERLLQLILSMLQLARVESGQQILHIETVDVRSVVANLLRGFQPVADGLSVTLKITGTEELTLTTDRQALQTILSNLVDNALKHTPAGGTVSVELLATPEGSSIVVRDSGVGIPEELLGRIFERFYRVEKDRSRERGGSGLGLAIVKHLSQSLGATVSVKSELGHGSEFWVQFRDESTSRS